MPCGDRMCTGNSWVSCARGLGAQKFSRYNPHLVEMQNLGPYSRYCERYDNSLDASEVS